MEYEKPPSRSASALTKPETEVFQRTAKSALKPHGWLTAADAVDHECYVYEMVNYERTGRILSVSREGVAQAQGVFHCPCAAQERKREERALERKLGANAERKREHSSPPKRIREENKQRKKSGQVIADALRPYSEKRYVTYEHAIRVFTLMMNAKKTRARHKAHSDLKLDKWEHAARMLQMHYYLRGNVIKPGDVLYSLQCTTEWLSSATLRSAASAEAVLADAVLIQELRVASSQASIEGRA